MADPLILNLTAYKAYRFEICFYQWYRQLIYVCLKVDEYL